MLESGSEVQNIISTGVDAAGDEALFMTYAFAWRSTGDAQSADEVEREREKQQQMAAMAVTSSIAAMRAMVLDGRINVTS
ncbi:hypothetical protein HIM_05228 [Hirsutella minnesotensis 3608]|uniref:Uncharacterized protein n=1 Tax=Hirsutella minnesotensis 3608 TaxID=1043627 RepID=A0A0F8A0G0_9HYPO|nr:hypothetical protein HIM_05228 [Hirsutella minnesotensis 3608]